jgi:hypothetical protein
MTTRISMLAIDLATGSFQVCAIGADGTCVDAPYLASGIRRCLRSDVCQASERGLHDATGRYAVRKAGFTSVQSAESARAPGLNLPP